MQPNSFFLVSIVRFYRRISMRNCNLRLKGVCVQKIYQTSRANAISRKLGRLGRLFYQASIGNLKFYLLFLKEASNISKSVFTNRSY